MRIPILSLLPVSTSVIGAAKSSILHCQKCLSPRELGQGSLVTQEAFSSVGIAVPTMMLLSWMGQILTTDFGPIMSTLVEYSQFFSYWSYNKANSTLFEMSLFPYRRLVITSLPDKVCVFRPLSEPRIITLPIYLLPSFPLILTTFQGKKSL